MSEDRTRSWPSSKHGGAGPSPDNESGPAGAQGSGEERSGDSAQPPTDFRLAMSSLGDGEEESERLAGDFRRALRRYCQGAGPRPKLLSYLPVARSPAVRRALYRRLVGDELDLLIREARIGRGFEDYLDAHPDPPPDPDEMWEWIEVEATGRVLAGRGPDGPESVLADLQDRFRGLMTPDRLARLDRVCRLGAPPPPHGYRFTRLLGRGGFAPVYLARYLELDEDRAIKVFTLDDLDASRLQRIRDEARKMARLIGHPNIVRVLDARQEAGHFYIIMEFLPGGSLGEKKGAGPYPLADAVDHVAQVAAAVQVLPRSRYRSQRHKAR